MSYKELAICILASALAVLVDATLLVLQVVALVIVAMAVALAVSLVVSLVWMGP